MPKKNNNNNNNNRMTSGKRPARNQLLSPNKVISDSSFQQIYSTLVRQAFVKTVYKGNISGSTSVDSFGSYNFKLSDISEATHFTNLFDQYRIVKIQVQLVPFNLPPIATTTAQFYAPLLMAVDYDDNATPTSAQQLYDHSNLKIITSGSQKPYLFTFKPSILKAAYTGSFSGYAPGSDQWLDCASTDILHYGIKWALATSSVIPTYGVYVRYFIEFRQAR